MHPDGNDWDPDYGGGVLPLTCEFCAAGVMPTHAHYMYRNRWRALIDVPLPADQETRNDQDTGGTAPNT